MDADKPTMVAIRAPNIVEMVRARLTEAIVTGEIAPGERLVEAELARRMNISRGPLREAARLLEQQGLLEAKPRRGFFVKKFGPEEIDNLYEMRACLQVEASRLAVRRMKPGHLQEMRRRFKAVEDAMDRGESVGKVLDAGLHFHRLVFEVTGNRRLIRAFDDLAVDTRHVSAVLNAYQERTTGKTDPFFKEHLPPIIEAFEGGDPELVASATRLYLAEGRRDHARVFARMRAERAAGNIPVAEVLADTAPDAAPDTAPDAAPDAAPGATPGAA